MKYAIVLLSVILFSCDSELPSIQEVKIPEAQYSLSDEQTHNKFSATIEPRLTVPSGSVIEFYTEEATDGQLNVNSIAADLANISFDLIHPLTGPVYVEDAKPGDVLAVTLHKIELGDWGWTGIFPGFSLLADDYTEPWLRTYELNKEDKTVRFNDDIEIPVKPFAGVLGVAPPTDSLLTTIPPRANGGNMDDPFMVEGTTVYLPVFVEGALFSIGDAHVSQGLGEVCGTAIEAPMRFIVELSLVKGNEKTIKEPQYETDEFYATTGFATTIDEATKKAVRYMIDYLVTEKGMDRTEAYALCSLAGDLHIAETVDLPHMLVTMHIPKSIFRE